MGFKIIEKVLVMDAVYWAPKVRGMDSQMTYHDPIDIKCRWVDTTQLVRSQRQSGAEITSRAEIMVDRDVVAEGVLWLGTVATLQNASPLRNRGAGIIENFEKLPTPKADKFLRTAYL